MDDDVVAPAETALVTLGHGRAHLWEGAGWGEYVHAVPHSFSTREVISIGAVEQGSGGQGAHTAHSAALLAAGALMPGCDALEIRYVAEPRTGAPTRLRMFLTAKSYRPGQVGGQLAASAVRAAASALPPTWVHEPVTRRWSDPQPCSGQPVVELRRHEEITFPQWAYVPADFFYLISDDPGDGAGWRIFWQALSTARKPVTLSLLFKPATLSPEEGQTLASVTTDLQIFAEARHDYDLTGRDCYYPADAGAAEALASWSRRIEQLHRPLMARVALRGSPTTVLPLASALAGAIGYTREDGPRPKPMPVDLPSTPGAIAAAAESFDWLEIYPWGGHPIWEDAQAPVSLRRLPYLYGLREASGVALLPVPDEQGATGFPLSRRHAARRSYSSPDTEAAGITLGTVMHHGSAGPRFRLPLTAINRHVLVVGSPGSGKTTTVLAMLHALWRDHDIPWLAVESTKHEYRSLTAAAGMEALRVICIGRDDVAPLRLNPLQPPAGTRREVHANALLAALRAALPLHAPLPQLLAEAIELAYLRAGWDDDTVPSAGIVQPTLRDLMSAFDDVFETKGYVGDARNVATALRVRLGSLLTGSKGRVLDTVDSVDFDDLLSTPTVIELNDVTDPEEKAVFVSLLIERLRAAAGTRRAVGGRLRHVTVLEEAHRLLVSDLPSKPSEDGGDARSAAVEALAHAIAELRATGEGFIVCSQSPSRLSAAAIANTGTRIVHRLESGADRDCMLGDFDAGDGDRAIAARLAVGEAICRWPDGDETEIVRIRAEGVDSSLDVPDSSVQDLMSGYTQSVRELLPYRLCSRQVCAQGCQPATRATGRRLAHEAGTVARRDWESAGGSVRSLAPIVDALAALVEGDPPGTYCGAVHLKLADDAFSGVDEGQLKEKLIEIVRSLPS